VLADLLQVAAVSRRGHPAGLPLLDPAGLAVVDPAGLAVVDPDGLAVVDPDGLAVVDPDGLARLLLSRAWRRCSLRLGGQLNILRVRGSGELLGLMRRPRSAGLASRCSQLLWQTSRLRHAVQAMLAGLPPLALLAGR